jgi:Outer membrane lipoprotein-sorting protein
MKKTILFLLILSCQFGLNAQNNFSTAQDSDPEAQNLLDQLKTQYDAYQSIEADFTLRIEIPEEEDIIQKGSITQQGEKYRLKMEDQAIISDGKTLWYHVITNNEVQINTIDPEDEDEEMLSPQNFLKVYEKNAFVCAPIMSAKENNQSVRWVELKPLAEDAEYFKLRLSLDNKKTELLQIKAFSKDGSRYTLALDGLRPNKTYKKDHFSFNVAQYPGIYVEDLRID